MRTTATRRSGLVLALLALAQLIISLDYNIVYVALPQIGSGVGFTEQSLQWVVSAYAVAFGGILLLGGRASDLYGPRRVFVLGLSLYGLASLAGGCAGDPVLLLAARAVQGIGGAFLFPATLTLVSKLFAAGRDRNRAFAVWGTAGGSGMILGSLLGGVLTESFGWPAVFFVNVPLVAAALYAAIRLIPLDVARTGPRRVDLAGTLTSTLGVVLVVVALVEGPETGWASPLVVGSGIAGVLALVGFVVIEHRSRHPLMPLRLLRERDLRTGMIVTFLYMGTFGSLLYFLTVYFQGVHGYGALQTGLAFLIPMAAIVAGSQSAGRMATRYGSRAVMIGSLVVGATGTVLVALTMTSEGSYLTLIPGLVVLGIGQGAGYTLMFDLASHGVAADERGIASGMASTTQQMGGAVGLAVLVAVANSGAADSLPGLRLAFIVAAVGIAATALVALGYSRPTRPTVVHASLS